MGLDIWFTEDVRNALLAADEASLATAGVIVVLGEPDSDQLKLIRVYREGYRAALCAVALAFGLKPQSVSLRKKLTLQKPESTL